MLLHLLLFVVALVAGAIASVSGFGIGSLLTPTFAVVVDTKVAVAAASIPHLAGTAWRFWTLRAHVDRHVLWTFGLASAAGGIAGALLHAYATSSALTVVFGALLLFVGVTGITGVSKQWRFHGPLGWIAGAASGVFGGLVGNQGGIRSAALLGFDLARDAFVATATAIALFVDFARMPVYLATQHERLAAIATLIGSATAGVLVGTVSGARILRRVPEATFRRVVSALLIVLGASMIVRAFIA